MQEAKHKLTIRFAPGYSPALEVIFSISTIYFSCKGSGAAARVERPGVGKRQHHAVLFGKSELTIAS